MIDLSYLSAFDTETTGVKVLEDRIVTSSIAYLGPLGNLIDNWDWLIDPGIDIPEEAAAVHGISTEHAREHGQDPAQAIYEISGILAYFLTNGVPVVAYNAAFDFSILNAEIRRHLGYNGFTDFLAGNPDAINHIIDPYILDLRLDKYRKGSRTLTASAKHYGVELENAHTSYDDCVAAAEVARGIWAKNPLLAEGTYEELFDLQVDWYREIMEGRAVYFKKQGREMDDFSTVWPIRT